MKLSENQPNYGNWVPEKLLILLWSLSGVAAVLLILNLTLWKVTALTVVFAILLAVLLFYAAYMQLFHHTFSFAGGGLMGKIHDYVADHLEWDGKGRLLDIGCGAGALTLCCAKKFPACHAIGLDYWGMEWNYAKEQCMKNAQLEQVSDAEFIKGDAGHLPFEDGYLDAVVSNFVFHEVHTVKDKRELVKESLRVLKKGGSFSLHDMFEQKNLYGNMDELIEELKRSGISEIHYEPHTENLPFVPGSIKLMFRDMGLLYGRK